MLSGLTPLWGPPPWCCVNINCRAGDFRIFTISLLDYFRNCSHSEKVSLSLTLEHLCPFPSPTALSCLLRGGSRVEKERTRLGSWFCDSFSKRGAPWRGAGQTLPASRFSTHRGPLLAGCAMFGRLLCPLMFTGRSLCLRTCFTNVFLGISVVAFVLFFCKHKSKSRTKPKSPPWR